MSFMSEMMDIQRTCDSMHYTPRLIYGVQEEDRDKIVSSILLDSAAPHVQRFASDVSKFHGGNMIYGCEMTVGEALSGDKMKKMSAVGQFVKKYNLGKPGFLLGIKGDYKLEHTEYEPDESTRKKGKSSKDQKIENDSKDDVEVEEVEVAKGGQSQAKSRKSQVKDSDTKDDTAHREQGKGKERKKAAEDTPAESGGAGKKVRH
jgi:hypothetical protein